MENNDDDDIENYNSPAEERKTSGAATDPVRDDESNQITDDNFLMEDSDGDHGGGGGGGRGDDGEEGDDAQGGGSGTGGDDGDPATTTTTVRYPQQGRFIEGTFLSDDLIWPPYCNPGYRMPSFIEVQVKTEHDEYVFPVSIVKSDPYSKRYLGGYRNKMNGTIYHHAATQTPVQKKESKDTSNLRTRETQTYEVRTLSTQSYREFGTQMERIDVRLDNKNDRVKMAGIYTTAAEVMKLKLKKTIEIQRFWRGYVARCVARRRRQQNAELDNRDKIVRQLAMEEEKEHATKEMLRRANPKTASDFAVLYNELDVWRQAEMAKIKASSLTGEEKAKAMSALLTSETKALQSIEKLKLAAQRDNSVERTQSLLEMMAEPHQWQLANGAVAHVQTPATQRAKELLDLYKALTAPVLASEVDSRLDILLHVKWTVREFDDPLTRDIADLVDREADLLNRGRPVKSMDKLRVRLNNLVLQFLDDPQYNPRAADFIVRK